MTVFIKNRADICATRQQRSFRSLCDIPMVRHVNAAVVLHRAVRLCHAVSQGYVLRRDVGVSDYRADIGDTASITSQRGGADFSAAPDVKKY